MLLSIEQICAGFFDDDVRVRSAVAWYFCRVPPDDPVRVLSLVRQAVERFGSGAFSSYWFLDGMTLDGPTIDWMIERLRADKQDASPQTGDDDDAFGEEDAFDFLGLQTVLRRAPAELLAPHGDQLRTMTELDEATREAIASKLELASLGAEELWTRLVEHARRMDSEESFDGAARERGNALVQLVARDADAARERVRSVLTDPAQRDTWLEYFGAELAGLTPVAEACPRLMGLLDDIEDLAFSPACEALAKVGDERILDELVAAYPSKGEDFRAGVVDVLDSSHLPSAALRALALYPEEDDEHLRARLLEAALNLMETEAIEPARRYVLDYEKHPDVLEVRWALLVLARLAGQTFPEFDAWFEDSKNDRAYTSAWLRGDELDEEDEDGYDEFDDDGSEGDDWEGGALEDDEEAADADTIHKQLPRVGRNERCPCGSGRKYKNCCMARDEAAEAAASALTPSRPGPAEYPFGTLAYYGPDEKTTTKIVAAAFTAAGAEPHLERWISPRILENPKAARQIKEFFARHRVKRIAASDGNMGCPHEEGIDFPVGEDCPQCPYWAGKQGSNRRE